MSTKSKSIIQYLILCYWTIFWLLNTVDKILGGAMFLWVGRDRFAQFHKFFESASLDSPIIADIALIFFAALEVFAFLFCLLALIYFFKKSQKESSNYFLLGTLSSLLIFTIFSIGDHLFGDRFELLEHTLFWIITLISWFVFKYLQFKNNSNGDQTKKISLVYPSIIVAFLIGLTTFSISSYNKNHFSERTDAIESVKIDDNTYKISFPFLGGSTVFEKSIEEFKINYPNKRIKHIYTVPNELRLKKADGLIFYINTEDKQCN